MSFISLVPEERAGPELQPLYEMIRQRYDFLPNYFQALGSRPDLVEAHLALGSGVMQGGELAESSKEQIGVVVSGLNTSSYCIAIHLELLRRMGIEKPLGRKLATDYANAPVDTKTQALFRFADKLTCRPADMEKEDVAALRQAGWSEAAVLEAVLAIAYFNFVNRVAAGLGLIADF